MTVYEYVIIGFGKAGKTFASFLASQGIKTALIEKSKERYGGTCINVACPVNLWNTVPACLMDGTVLGKKKKSGMQKRWRRRIVSPPCFAGKIMTSWYRQE